MLLSTIAALIYIVMPGDTLGAIAHEHGTTVPALASANGIADPNLIYVGDELLVGTDAPLQLDGRNDLAGAIARHFPDEVARAMRVAMCESRGQRRAFNPNGHYGIWQFSLATWRGIGGWGDPRDATVDEQTRLAKALRDRYGWDQWECR